MGCLEEKEMPCSRATRERDFQQLAFSWNKKARRILREEVKVQGYYWYEGSERERCPELPVDEGQCVMCKLCQCGKNAACCWGTT